MTTTSQNPPWVLKKAVLVHAPNFDVSCFARLRIAHDETANRGSISLRITTDLANLSGRSQVLTLNVPPERVEEGVFTRTSNDSLCSSSLVSMLQAPVTDVSAVSTLSLRLNTTGIVLCPSEMKSLCPANQEDLNFRAFAKICQSRHLRLHFSRRQFVNSELDRLGSFSCSLGEESLQTEPFDHARHGVVQRDWRAFNLSPDPPPYCEEPVSEQIIGKRGRDQWSMPPDIERRKRLLLPSPQPMDSPTEVNTPSTLSPSPSSIRPTYLTHTSSPSRTERNTLTRLEHDLRGISDDLICQLLIRSGHQHLLAKPKDVDSNLPAEFEKVRFTEVKMSHLKRYVDEMIEHRLKSHVADDIVDSAVSECRDQIFDECKTNEAEFREQVDDGNSEVRITANECMNEMKEQVQKYMREIEEQVEQYMTDIEDQGIKVEMSAKKKVAMLKHWFNASVQCSLSPSHELGTNGRRNSI